MSVQNNMHMPEGTEAPRAHGPAYVLVLLVLVLVAGVIIFFMLRSDGQSEDVVPVEPVAESEQEPKPQEEIVPTNDQAPVELPASVEARIRAITARVDAGELSLEEAQNQVNVILGLN